MCPDNQNEDTGVQTARVSTKPPVAAAASSKRRKVSDDQALDTDTTMFQSGDDREKDLGRPQIKPVSKVNKHFLYKSTFLLTLFDVGQRWSKGAQCWQRLRSQCNSCTWRSRRLEGCRLFYQHFKRAETRRLSRFQWCCTPADTTRILACVKGISCL